MIANKTNQSNSTTRKAAISRGRTFGRGCLVAQHLLQHAANTKEGIRKRQEINCVQQREAQTQTKTRAKQTANTSHINGSNTTTRENTRYKTTGIRFASTSYAQCDTGSSKFGEHKHADTLLLKHFVAKASAQRRPAALLMHRCVRRPCCPLEVPLTPGAPPDGAHSSAPSAARASPVKDSALQPPPDDKKTPQGRAQLHVWQTNT